jgi:hypothetical protein
MTALLSLRTKEEKHSVIRFLWSKDASGATVHQRLSAQYENPVLPQQIRETAEQVRRLSTATNEDDVECASDTVLLDERLLLKWRPVYKLVIVLPTK